MRKKFLRVLILIFLFTLPIKPFKNIVLSQSINLQDISQIYSKIYINNTYKEYYTGKIDNQLFISKDLFSQNPVILTTDISYYYYSEGIFINQKDDKYFLLSNISTYFNNFKTLLTYFNDDGNNIEILNSYYFESFYNYFLTDATEYYDNGEKKFILTGLIGDSFDTDLFISLFDSNDIINSILLGTSALDYPFYCSEYQDSNFDGFVLLSIVDKNKYRDFLDTKLSFLSQRYNSNSILVSFLDKKLRLKKSFLLQFPNQILNLSIVKKSINDILLRVDFIDKISGYYISSAFVNINYYGIFNTNSYNNLNDFYVDKIANIKVKNISFKKLETKIYFKRLY